MDLSHREREVEGVLEQLGAAVLVDAVHTARRLMVDILRRKRRGLGG